MRSVIVLAIVWVLVAGAPPATGEGCRAGDGAFELSAAGSYCPLTGKRSPIPVREPARDPSSGGIPGLLPLLRASFRGVAVLPAWLVRR